MFDLRGKRVWVAGHRGMVGGAIVRQLPDENCEILTTSRQDVDLRNQAAVNGWVDANRPDAIVIAAAKVGGIWANSTYPADFLYDNLMIVSNIVNAAYNASASKILFLGSSCIYPKFSEQPIREESLLTGPLEATNQWYAIAKITGIKMMQAYREQHGCDYISAMPTNLYGPGDNFDLLTSHVLPALIRKAHEAKLSGAQTLTIWGTGTPRREFLHVEDCARACIHLLKNYSGEEHLNIGSGEDLTIMELVEMVCEVVGFDGVIVTDPTKPDGTPRKQLSIDRIRATGWAPRIGLREGVTTTYDWFLNNVARG